MQNLTSSSGGGDVNTQLSCGLLDTEAQKKLQFTGNVHASQLWLLFLFNYFSIEVEPTILSPSAPPIQPADIGSVHQDLENIQKGELKNAAWKYIFWKFDMVFVGHFLFLSACIFTFKLITPRLSWNTVIFLPFSSEFIVTFLSSAEMEGDWIKQELQNLELEITIQMDFL